MIKNRTVSVIFIHSLIAKIKSHKKDINALLRDVEIDPDLLDNPKSRVSIASFAKLARQVCIEMSDESAGYFKRPQKLGTFNVMMRYSYGSNNLFEAIQRMIEFYSLFDSGYSLQCTEENAQHTALYLDCEPALANEAWIYELMFMTHHRLFCWLTETHFMLHSVHMPFREPSYLEEYSYLFSCPIFFEQPRAKIVFAKQYLNLPIHKNQKRLEAYLNRAPYDLLYMSKNDKSMSEKVRRCIKNSLPKIPDYEHIAEHLHIHPQTLRRRLKSEGCDYRQLRNEMIRDLAISHLRRGELEIKQISYLLGFSEPSAFIRSFKRWTGNTPNQFRKNAHNNKR